MEIILAVFQISLTLIIGVLLLYIFKIENEFRKERADLLSRIMAKNLTEYTSGEIIKEEAKNKDEEEKEPDVVPLEDADENYFSKIIKKQLEQTDGSTE